jgi:hypothetical protein
MSSIGGGALSGAGTGATIGSAFGPIGTGVGAAGGALIGGLSSFLSRKRGAETPIQGQQRELIDELLASLKGQGQFSGLFQMDEGTFQKSFVDPALSRFRTQTAPQIQQSFIAGGQQRGTGLEDTLSRAGVELDQLLNQQFAQQQQGAQERQLKGIGGILGAKPGALPTQPGGEAIQQGVGGFLASPQFQTGISDILNSIRRTPARKGFEQEETPLV